MARTESETVETLNDFLEWARQFDDGTYVFRGVPNDKYRIQASAYRRVPETDQNSEDDRASYTPLSADEHAKRAEQSFRRHKFEETIAGYDKAIYRKPDDASLHCSRGIAKAKLEEYDAAIADYDEAIRLNSSYASAYHQRGLVKAELRQYDSAIADYDEAIRLNPNDEFIYNQREFLKAQQERSEAEI